MKAAELGQLLNHRTTVIWIVLVAVTLLSWQLATCGSARTGHRQFIGVSVLAVGCLKARYIGLEFMELRHAPLALRMLLDIALCGAFLLLTALFMAT